MRATEVIPGPPPLEVRFAFGRELGSGPRTAGQGGQALAAIGGAKLMRSTQAVLVEPVKPKRWRVACESSRCPPSMRRSTLKILRRR